MNKKLKITVVFECIILLFLLRLISGCAYQTDYSGVYMLGSGNCSSAYITLKKVEGFGEKYYIITIYKENYVNGNGTEFLGVIKGDTINVKHGTIIIEGTSLNVQSGDKVCSYTRIGGIK